MALWTRSATAEWSAAASESPHAFVLRTRGETDVGGLRRVRVAEVVHVPTERTDIVEDPRRSENRGGALDTRAALP